MTREKKLDYLKRYCILLISLLIMAFGVAFSIQADLGTSPISSLPYVTSLISGLTVGQTTILLHCTLIVLQILLLRKRYQKIQLLQLPIAVVFGYLTDFTLAIVQNLSCSSYFERWIFCVIGIILIGFGVSWEVMANVIMLAGEGFVSAVVQVSGKPFPRLKVAFDCSLVAISVVLSFLFLHGLTGVREGTVAAALLVGPTSKIMRRWMEPILFKKR